MTSGTAAVPSTIDDVNAEWLTAVLRADETVRDGYRRSCRTDRTRQWVLITAVPASRDRGPRHAVESHRQVARRLRAGEAMRTLGGYAREIAFYRHVAGRAPMRTPHVYAARMAENSADFVLVLEDLRHWDNADHLAGLSLDRARCCIAQLAALHAWSTNPPYADVLEAFPSIDTPMTRDLLPAVFSAGWQIYREKAGEPVPPAVTRFAERFAEFAPTAIQALSERSMLIHGDIRADNMFFPATN